MYRKLLPLSLIASTFAIFSVVLAGCNHNNSVSSTTPSNPSNPSNPGSTSGGSFSISSTVPANAATNVALNSTIQIVFSSAANASTVNTADIAVTDPSGNVSGAVNYNTSNNTATFSPSDLLVAGTTYTVKVSGVMSSGGTEMSSGGSFTFSTVAPSPAATLQYEAPLGGYGQVSVDTAGNVTIQLQGATSTAGKTLTTLFCAMRLSYNVAPTCITVGTVSTDASGNGTMTAKFPQSGTWAGDFELFPGVNPDINTTVPSYETQYGTNYMSTLQPDSTVDAGVFGGAGSGYQQAQLTSGTVTYSSSSGASGTFTFTLTGAPANTTFEAAESVNGLQSYQLVNSSGGQFVSDGQGNLTVTVSIGGGGGDIMQIGPMNSMNPPKYLGYVGGFSVP